MRSHLTIVGLVLLAVMLLSGCTFFQEAPVPDFPGAVLVEDDANVLPLLEFARRESGREVRGDVQVYRLPENTTPADVLDFYSAELTAGRGWEETRSEIGLPFLGVQYGNGTWTKGNNVVDVHVVPALDESGQPWMLKTEVRER